MRTKSVFVLALVTLCGACGPGTVEGPPNILLVMVDDMGFTDLASYGSEIETPNLDALAAEGLRFTNFRASVSCSPTRSMLLTGLDNHQAGLGTMGELILPWQEGAPGYEGYLTDNVATLPEILRGQGYHTYMAGKWHLGHEPDRYPSARGFDRAFALLYGGASHWDDMSGIMTHETPAYYTLNGTKLDALPADFYSSRSYSDFLMESIRENHGDGNPFFAYLALTAPHDPLQVPEPWRSKYQGRYAEGYEVLREERVAGAKDAGVFPAGAAVTERYPMTRPWASLSEQERAIEEAHMEVYAGMVDNADYHFGRVVDFLRDIGEYDNTIVIFLSDNGPNPWYSEEYPTNVETGFLDQFDNRPENMGNKTSHSAYGIGWAAASSGPLDLFKMSVAEGGIRVPLIIAGPGIQAVDEPNTSFAYVTDLLPTILELADIDHPTAGGGASPLLAPTGRSMAGLLKAQDESIHEDGTLIAGEMLGGRWISDGRYKAVLVAEPYGRGVWELYDLQEDPGETRDIARDMPDVLDRMIDAWNDYAAEVGVLFPPQ